MQSKKIQEAEGFLQRGSTWYKTPPRYREDPHCTTSLRPQVRCESSACEGERQAGAKKSSLDGTDAAVGFAAGGWGEKTWRLSQLANEALRELAAR